MKKKILVVDDDYGLRELLDMMFGEQYNVLKAKDVLEAREILRNPVDLIILDIMLPGIDGYTFCKEIKDSLATKHIPVLILTAKYQIPDMQPSINADADEYLTKPFDSDYLVKRITVLVEKIPEEIPDEGKLVHFGGGFHYVRNPKNRIF
jgi:two-component system response regulator ResD